MNYNTFFTNNDKPYAENLNDSLLLIDAFDVIVPVALPNMFDNEQFNSEVNVPRKCGVGIVTLKSVSNGVTIASSQIQGTGEVVFRVYPNFNSFYKWQSIIFEKTGTVNVGFKKTDGSVINATVNNNGVISENSHLKTLQEIDVVLTLDNANINNILIKFTNKQNNHRTNALLEANQLVNVNGAVATGETKAVNGGTVYTALNNMNTTFTSEISYLTDNITLLNNSKEKTSNKVNTLDNNTSHYPSCKAVNTALNSKANTNHTHTAQQITDLFNKIYPIGSIYMSVNNVNPSTLFGGTWARLENRFLLGSGSKGAGSSGGEETHTLTVSEMPSHTHAQNSHNHSLPNSTIVYDPNDSGSIPNGNAKKYTTNTAQQLTTGGATGVNQNTGGGQPHNNMPPYLVVNMWQRIS